MHLKTIKRYFTQIRFVKKTFKKYKNLLCKGKYELLPCMRIILLKDDEIKELGTKYFGSMTGSKTSTRISNLVNKFFALRNKKSKKDLYQAIYIANNYDKEREIKLFSFNQKEILTICTDEQSCNKQISQYETLRKFFGMPKVSQYNEIEHAYKISMVDVLSHPSDDEAIKNIVDCMMKYHKQNDSNVISISEILNFNDENEEAKKMLLEIASYLTPNILDKKIATCLQHGDLSRDNLIYGTCEESTGFWWIDWEHLRERIFFYDFFFYMLNTAIYFEDKNALNSYLSGKYDENMFDWFKQFGSEYDDNCRKDYFIVFAIDFLKQRVCPLNNIRILKSYCDFIKEIIL